MSATNDLPSSVAHVSLRDWLAGQALVGLIPTPRQPGVLPMNIDGMADAAYRYADAMLKARGR